MSYSNPYQDPPRPYPGGFNDSTPSLVNPDRNNPHNGAYQNFPNPGGNDPNSLHSPPGNYPYAAPYTPSSLNDPGMDQFDMGYAGHLQGKGRAGYGQDDEEEEKAPLTAQFQ